MFQQLKQEVYDVSYFVVLSDYVLLNSLVMSIKKAFLGDYFLLGLPKLPSMSD